MEKWKKINGYKDYFVSSKGRIKSENDRGNWGNGRVLKTIVRKSGYCVVNLYCYSYDGKKLMKQHRVHQLVANAFIPNPENKPLINHIDGNKENNIVENLEWCTHSENMQHSYENNLHNQPKGIKTTKLNEEKVLEIRAKYSNGNVSQLDLSKEYNVSESTIRNIVKKKSWKWV